MVYRVFVEKKPAFRQEAEALRREAVEILGIAALKDVRIINRYDAEELCIILIKNILMPLNLN